MKKIISIFNLVIILACLCLLSCTPKKTGNTSEEIITVKSAPTQTVLYFSSNIQPLKSYPVMSPVEGAVKKKYFVYGQPVKKSQTLFDITSKDLQQNYQSALTTYVKAKNDFLVAKDHFVNTEELYKLGIIARDEYTTEKNNLENLHLQYLQSEANLEAQVKDRVVSEKELSLEDTSKIAALLKQTVDSIKVKSPADGIALYSTQDSSSGSSDKIEVGDQVKQGGVLALIGDLSGLSATFQANEMNIDNIKPKQAIILTGDAFPDFELKGEVQEVGTQAKATPGSMEGIPTFIVKIIIPHITAQQRKVLRVGMSAKIKLTIPGPNEITIPISAVHQVNDKSMVTVIAKDGHRTEVSVETGETTVDNVVIKSGLAPGDSIVVSH